MSSQVTTLLGAAGPPANHLLTQRRSLPEPARHSGCAGERCTRWGTAAVILTDWGAFGL